MYLEDIEEIDWLELRVCVPDVLCPQSLEHHHAHPRETRILLCAVQQSLYHSKGDDELSYSPQFSLSPPPPPSAAASFFDKCIGKITPLSRAGRLLCLGSYQ